MPLRPNSGLLLRYWCRKDKAFCERLFTLYRQHSEKDKQHDDLPLQRKILPTPMVGSCSCWQLFGCQVCRCQLTVVLEHLNQLCLMTVLFRLSNFLAYHAFHRYPASAVLLNYAPLQLEAIAKCLNQVLLIANETQRWLSLVTSIINTHLLNEPAKSVCTSVTRKLSKRDQRQRKYWLSSGGVNVRNREEKSSRQDLRRRRKWTAQETRK